MFRNGVPIIFEVTIQTRIFNFRHQLIALSIGRIFFEFSKNSSPTGESNLQLNGNNYALREKLMSKYCVRDY